MSDGTINIPERASAPASPAANRHKVFIDSAGVLSTIDDLGVVKTYNATAGVFGQNNQFTESEIQTSYSTLTPTAYLNLVTPPLPLGTYRVGFNCVWSYDDVLGDAAHFDILDNGVSHLPTDITMETKNIFDKPVLGSFLYLENVSGVRTIELKVHCDNIADTLTMFSAYLEIWRVE